MKGLLWFAILAAPLSAAVRLPALISDHMVLQRETPLRIWGWADPAETVTVKLRQARVTATAGADGRWQVWLPPTPAGGPFELSVNDTTIRDVMVGEVWIASGQSNMAMTVARSDKAAEETAAARNGAIRFFRAARAESAQPLDDLKGKWEVCSPETAGAFSAVAYFFARDLQPRLKAPIGIVQNAVGGSPAQAWTSPATLSGDAALRPLLDVWSEQKKATPPPQPFWEPSVLYHGLTAPAANYAIRGALWYQGEHNGSRGQGDLYHRLFTSMIRDWRELWGQGDFPFLYVQLPNFITPAKAQWPEVREAQRRALELRNTGMAVTMGLGNPKDVHPTHKQEVGLRLALLARCTVYGENVACRSPLFVQAAAETGAVRIRFESAAGLRTRDGQPVRGFELAGADGRFTPAEAAVEGETVLVRGTGAQVRYGWADNPDLNLINGAGLPASPFRARVH